MKTYEEQLEEVQKAISDILSGAQEASYNGQKVKKAELTQLLTYEKYLKSQLLSQKRRGIRVKGVTPV